MPGSFRCASVARETAADKLRRVAGPAFWGGILLLLLPAGTLRARDDLPPGLNQGPMIHFEDRRWDFGQAPQQTLVRHTFRFSNEGTAPLKIFSVQPGCGCTVAVLGDSLLAPGDSSHIEIQLNTERSEGSEQKVVAVHSNDPAEPECDLLLLCYVKPEIQVEQRVFDFGDVKLGSTPVMATSLAAAKGSGFKILGADGGEGIVSWVIKAVPSDTADVSLLEAHLLPNARLGRFNQRIPIRMQNTKMGIETIAIRGMVYSYFRLQSDKLDFIPIKKGKRYTLSTIIDSNGDRPYEVVSASASSPMVKPSLRKKDNGYVVTVMLEPQTRIGRFKDTVVLKTTDPAQPEMQLEVRAKVSD